jgi:hypothetical protein
VLQRFYKKYPSSKYEVIACEKVSKDWIPMAAAAGGALITLGIGAGGGAFEDSTGTTLALVIAGSLGSIGFFVGSLFSTNYVVTYIERYPAAMEPN